MRHCKYCHRPYEGRFGDGCVCPNCVYAIGRAKDLWERVKSILPHRIEEAIPVSEEEEPTCVDGETVIRDDNIGQGSPDEPQLDGRVIVFRKGGCFRIACSGSQPRKVFVRGCTFYSDDENGGYFFDVENVSIQFQECRFFGKSWKALRSDSKVVFDRCAFGGLFSSAKMPVIEVGRSDGRPAKLMLLGSTFNGCGGDCSESLVVVNGELVCDGCSITYCRAEGALLYASGDSRLTQARFSHVVGMEGLLAGGRANIKDLQVDHSFGKSVVNVESFEGKRIKLTGCMAYCADLMTAKMLAFVDDLEIRNCVAHGSILKGEVVGMSNAVLIGCLTMMAPAPSDGQAVKVENCRLATAEEIDSKGVEFIDECIANMAEMESE